MHKCIIMSHFTKKPCDLIGILEHKKYISTNQLTTLPGKSGENRDWEN